MDYLKNRANTPSFKGLDSTDFHSWVEVDGVKLDYPTKLLMKQSFFGTKKLKYVEFGEDIQAKLQEKWRENYQYKVEQLQNTDIDYNRVWVTTPNFCFYRAFIMYDRLVAKKVKNVKIKYGSLGFIQSDGTTYYEFG